MKKSSQKNEFRATVGQGCTRPLPPLRCSTFRAHCLPLRLPLQFEDFQTEKAFEILHRQRSQLLCL